MRYLVVGFLAVLATACSNKADMPVRLRAELPVEGKLLFGN